MEKFAGLLKQKTKHLAVFEQARKGLMAVQDQIQELLADTEEHKLSLQDEIEEADAEMAWLKAEAERTKATEAKIAAVLA